MNRGLGVDAPDGGTEAMIALRTAQTSLTIELRHKVDLESLGLERKIQGVAQEKIGASQVLDAA